MTGGAEPVDQQVERGGSARLVLRDALVDGSRADVLLVDGVVAAVLPPGRAGDPHGGPGEVLDLGGRLLLPAFVEPHTHLDKALVGPLGGAGGLAGAIDAWNRDRGRRSAAETAARAEAALLEYVRHGTGTVRTHVDAQPGSGTGGVEAVVGAGVRAAHLVQVQVVAMAGLPLTGPAGGAARSALLDALDAGAGLVGGAPWLDPDPRAALDVLLAVAAERGLGVDLHVDEALAVDVATVGHLVAAVDAGFDLPVTAGHVVALGQAPLSVQRATAEDLARTGIGVVTNPRTNLWLQDRETPVAARRGLTAVRALLDAGVAVGAGADNLRDPFNPYGAADPLQVAQLLAWCAPVSAGEALHAVTDGARAVVAQVARVLPGGPGGAAGSRVQSGSAGSLVQVGQPADLVALAARGADDALAGTPADRLVLHRGRVVARRTVVDDPLPVVLPDGRS
ncbi:MAG TPA: amidohydrolase family protein [Cellulomonas sp.]